MIVYHDLNICQERLSNAAKLKEDFVTRHDIMGDNRTRELAPEISAHPAVNPV